MNIQTLIETLNDYAVSTGSWADEVVMTTPNEDGASIAGVEFGMRDGKPVVALIAKTEED